MMAASRVEWAASTQAIHREAAGVMELWAVLLTDLPPMLAAAQAGDGETLRMLRIVNHAVLRIRNAPRGREPLCGGCGGPLHGSDFAFVVALPSVDAPTQSLALAICPSCGTDRASVKAAGVRALKELWPDSREITPHAEGGQA